MHSLFALFSAALLAFATWLVTDEPFVAGVVFMGIMFALLAILDFIRFIGKTQANNMRLLLREVKKREQDW